MMPTTTEREMAHPLLERLRKLRSRLRALLLLRDGSRIAAWTFATLLIAMVADVDLRLPPQARAIILFGVVALAGVAFYRRVIVAWRYFRDPRALAGHVELQFPEFNDSLLSAVEFLELPPSELSGSAALRDHAIEQATLLAGELDLNEAVPSRKLKRSIFALGVVIVVAIVLGGRYPDQSATAITRLADPYGDHRWPARTTLRVVSPTFFPHHAVRREAFEFRAIVGGRVPERSIVTFWPGNGRPSDQFIALPKPDPATGEALLAFRIDADKLEHDLKIRVRVGDADSGWQAIDVHTPPQLVPFDGRPSPRITLTFPRYTGLPVRELLDGTTSIEVVTGTVVDIRAAVDRPVHATFTAMSPPQRSPVVPALAPLAAANMPEAVGLQLLSESLSPRIPVVTDTERTRIELNFVPRYSGQYLLRLPDDAGFASERLFDIRVDTDPAPRVALGPLLHDDLPGVTVDAELSLRGMIDDPFFGIRQVDIEYRTLPNGQFSSLPWFDTARWTWLHHAASQLMPMPLQVPSSVVQTVSSLRLSQQMTLRQFRRADGSALVEGDILSIRLRATDSDDVTWSKPPGRSETIDVPIVSADQLEAALAKRLTAMRIELLNARDLEVEARRQARALLDSAATAPRLEPAAINALPEVERRQQQIDSLLTEGDAAVASQLDRLADAARRNHLPDSATMRRLTATIEALRQLRTNELNPLRRKFAEAKRDGSSAALTAAETHMRDTVDQLQNMIDRLRADNGVAETRAETRAILNELRRQQNRLAQLQQSLPGDAAGQKPEQLTEAQRAQAERLAAELDLIRERQRGLLDGLETQAAQSTGPDQKTVKEALGQIDRSGLSVQANAAPDHVRNNRLSEAKNSLAEGIRQLEQLLAALGDKPKADDLDRLSKASKAVAKQIDRLIERQEKLQDRIQAARNIADSERRATELRKLAAEQRQIIEETEALRRRNGGTGMADLRDAARAMEENARALERGESPSGDKALDQLDESREAVEQNQQRAEEELERLRRTDLADLLQSLRDRQFAAREENVRLHERVAARGRWDVAAGRGTLPGLIETQLAITREAKQLSDTRFVKEPVFAGVARSAVVAMTETGERLQQHKEDVLDQLDGLVGFDAKMEETRHQAIIGSLDRALYRLDRVIAALKAAPAKAPKAEPKKAAGPKSDMTERADTSLPAAQLRLLHRWQTDLTERTDRFHRDHPDREAWGQADRRVIQLLAGEQAEVAELMNKLVESMKEERP